MRPLLAFLLLSLPVFAGDFRLTSPDFTQGSSIPPRFTCEGKNEAPTLEFSNVPTSAKSLVLIVDDPDAPSGTFTHWLLWNIPPDIKKIPTASIPELASQGTNDFGRKGYSGPCPPSGTHRYFFRLSALDISLSLPATTTRNALTVAIRSHVLSTATLMARYSKSASQ